MQARRGERRRVFHTFLLHLVAQVAMETMGLALQFIDEHTKVTGGNLKLARQALGCASNVSAELAPENREPKGGA